ncbi:hypothetical protein [Anaerocellum diazotrophicum]|uniref:SLH domain-containing protein n=1 Tax=Caldicellulosiruptor diazotrophicus TaxID=2806205 RepID=A0ABM7NQK7_9FIRM|nr:hypothetical protein [Caldicellulosiruptor diazotrophicus]BCS82361.1 hypothetical protein CaldiYA01_23210 [Caldicellulosiruptor diazotrophicus]
MRKLLSFAVILSLLLTFAFPVAQAGTITQAVTTAINKIDYITAGEFVTSLLIGAKVKPNGIADYWGKAQTMGLIPAEVKKDRPITRAQASYIVWKLINAVPELKDKNIPVSVRRVPPTEAFMRGICFFGGPLASNYDIFNRQIVGYDLTDFIQGYQLLVMEYKYADGRTEYKYVWDRYKDASLAPGTYKYIDDPFRKILAEFKKKYPDKIVYAPRPYQKGWMFTIDPLVEVKKLNLKYPTDVYCTNFDSYTKKYVKERYSIDSPERIIDWLFSDIDLCTPLGIPLTRFDLAAITYLYHTQGREVFQGGIANYNIKEHPYFNMYLEDFLVNYPRKYPTDHTRFAYYCKDYSKIPQMYREPMLHLADLGIITPDQSALYIGVYYFNAGKTLTRAEAVQMIARVFDKSKRDVLDEFNSKVQEYWAVKNEVGLGYYVYYDDIVRKFVTSQNKYSFDEMGGGVVFANPQVIVRIEEPKVMSITRVNAKLYPQGYGGFGLAQQISLGDYDLAGFGVGDRGCIVYDEVDSVKVEISDNQKTQLIDYVPLAYRDELKKDLANYTPAKVKSMSKSGEILKQYGDVYINYKAKPIHGRIMDYELYTVIPQYKLTDKNYYPILIAKPNPKYKQ